MLDDIELAASADQLQEVDNVLADTSTPKHTRLWLLQRAAAGAAVGAAGLAPAKAAFGALDRVSVDSVQTVLTTAATAEALAVTVLSASVQVAKGTPVEPFLPVLQAANSSEYDHFKALGTLGGHPLTTKFWIPDAALGANNINLFKTLETAETLFINAYLIGITAGVTAKLKPNLIRYMAEILGVEAEHRALARYARSKVESEMVQVPNNKGFETYTITSMADIVKALEGAGFGFGKQGAMPGKFATFPGDPRKNGTGSAILANTPA